MENLKQRFAEHLTSLGYELNVPREVILVKLRRKMGEARFDRVFAGAVAGSSTARKEELYSQSEDIEEANLMRSLEPRGTLDTSVSLYRQCSRHLIPGARVIDLGCRTGGLASFIATRHPGCSVVGVDLARNVIAACASYYRLPNLEFRPWNYKYRPPEDIEPADVLLCSTGVVHERPQNRTPCDLSSARASAEYARQREQALRYLAPWRTVARDGATLFAVLRLRLYPRFLAWTDAAQQAGWTPRLERLWQVDLPDEKVTVPGFVFEAKQSPALPEEAVLDRWATVERGGHLFGRLTGGAALAVYRAMTAKTTLAQREYKRGTLMTRDEVGRSAGIGYVFTHNATSKYRLLLLASSKAQALAAGVSAPASRSPITDDGEFESGDRAGAGARQGYVVQTGAVFGGTQIRVGTEEDRPPD